MRARRERCLQKIGVFVDFGSSSILLQRATDHVSTGRGGHQSIIPARCLVAAKRRVGRGGDVAGGPSAFFRNPVVFWSAPQPAIRFHLLRDPVNCPISRPQRERAGHLARRDFQRSRIRCSWRLGPVRLRQASPRADDEEEQGVPKKRGWPLTASAPSVQPHVPRLMSNPKRGSAPPAPRMPPNEG